MTTAERTIDLDLEVRAQGRDRHRLTARLHPAGGVPAPAVTASVRLGIAALHPLEISPELYGQELGRRLFASTELRSVWDQAMAFHEGQGLPLRVRLRLEGGELQSILWEALAHPARNLRIAASERIWLTRLVTAAAPAAGDPDRPLHALALVADPTDGPAFRLPAVGAAEQVALLRTTAGGAAMEVLARAPGCAPPTLSGLSAALRRGPSLVYLLAHGTWTDQGAYICLESPAGDAEFVAADELAELFTGLTARPMLIVLLVCRSAAADTAKPPDLRLLALGPQLVRAGAPSVLAVQGDLAQRSARPLITALQRELHRGAPVERAVAAARFELRADDWWRLVLFQREGSIPQFTAAAAAGAAPPDYRRGLDALRERLPRREQRVCDVLALRLRTALEDERRGSTELTRRELVDVLDQLDRLARERCGQPFLDLCRP